VTDRYLPRMGDDKAAAASGHHAAGSWTDEPVRIVPYDPTWPARFEEERSALVGVLEEWAPGGIHHVGSTSVPGLASKPIIDILVGVTDLERSRSCFERLSPLGYLYAPYRTEEMHWFCKPDPGRRTHHLHLVPTDSPRFRDELLLRDYLRGHPPVAAEYGELKRRLAQTFEHDREAYTAAKADFIRATLRRARATPTSAQDIYGESWIDRS
jgi:GrpB-like predicted nucleotidyltransferase (UPF0157 family)